MLLTVNDQAGAGRAPARCWSRRSPARTACATWRGSRRTADASSRLSDGQVGYVYVPDTGVERPDRAGAPVRAASSPRTGLIIDERFNSGGQIPDRFIELLNRPLRNYWAVRDGQDWQWPPVAHFGPKAMLINGWSGSGGDCFPLLLQAGRARAARSARAPGAA